VLHFSYKRWVFEKTELEKQGEFWHPENGTGYGLEGGFFGSSWLCSLQQSHLDPPTQVRSVLYPFSRFFYSPLRLQTLRTLVFQQSARLFCCRAFGAEDRNTKRFKRTAQAFRPGKASSKSALKGRPTGTGENAYLAIHVERASHSDAIS